MHIRHGRSGAPGNGRAVACRTAGQPAKPRHHLVRSTPLTETPINGAAKEDAHLQVMRLIDANPKMSQREIASELGISLGKANYCLRALTEKGFVKARNFRRSTNKMRYIYRLTPKGIEHKARLTVAFLERKRQEYEALRREIDALSKEASRAGD